MNYIYDISLNFNKELYNFYEWNKDDNVEFYLKIPIFKVEDKVINDIINTIFIVDKIFLNKILNKTESYSKKRNKYSCLFTSETKVLGVSFDENGESILKSYLSIDEESDILEFSKLIKYSLVEYKVKERKNLKNAFLTRSENDTKNNILIKINDIYNKKQYDKLKYVFYEVYNERSNNEQKIYSKLINLVQNNTNKINYLKDIFDDIKIESNII